MDQEHKTDSQERDALLREILDDTSPNRPAAKPPQRPPVSHAAEEEPVPVVSHAAENSAPVSHANLHPLQSQQHHRLTHGMPTCQNPTGTLAAHRHFRPIRAENMLLR